MGFRNLDRVGLTNRPPKSLRRSKVQSSDTRHDSQATDIVLRHQGDRRGMRVAQNLKGTESF